MLERIKKALQVETISQIYKYSIEKYSDITENFQKNNKQPQDSKNQQPQNFTILKKNYRFKEQDIKTCRSYYHHINLNKLTLSFICTVILSNKKVAKLKFSNTMTLQSLSDFISRHIKSDQRYTCIQIHDIIFTQNIIDAKDAISEYISNSKVDYRDMNHEIDKLKMYPGMEIFYFDGCSKTYRIRIKRIEMSETIDNAYFESINEKVIMCKGCLNNISVIYCEEDPILPPKEKHLCKPCFDQLFMDENNKIKYPDMKFRYL